MIESQVPEFSDGGYWYVVPASVGPSGEITADVTTGRWCGWTRLTEGALYYVIRSVEPLASTPIVSGFLVSGLLPPGKKPTGRIEGL